MTLSYGRSHALRGFFGRFKTYYQVPATPVTSLMAEKNHYKQLAAALARRTEQGADAAQIAFAVTTAMETIETTLKPIIGKGGVVAMYRRSLLVVGSSHPWLATSDSTRSEIDLIALRSLLSERGAAEAANAGGALLQTFCDLLASLVGNSLSERLLRNVNVDL